MGHIVRVPEVAKDELYRPEGSPIGSCGPEDPKTSSAALQCSIGSTSSSVSEAGQQQQQEEEEEEPSTLDSPTGLTAAVSL